MIIKKMIEKINQKFLGENKHRMFFIIVTIILSILLYFCNFLKYPDYINSVGLCNNSGLCEFFWSRGIAWPLFSGLPYLVISSFLLILFPKNIFKLWAKIMIPIFVIFLLITIMTPDICGGMICFDRTNVASGLSKLFLIVTVLIAVIKTIYNFAVLKKKNN